MADLHVYAPTDVAAGMTTLAPVVFPHRVTGLSADLVATDAGARVAFELDFVLVSPGAPPDNWSVGDNLVKASGTRTCGVGFTCVPTAMGTLQAVVSSSAPATFSCTVTTP